MAGKPRATLLRLRGFAERLRVLGHDFHASVPRRYRDDTSDPRDRAEVDETHLAWFETITAFAEADRALRALDQIMQGKITASVRAQNLRNGRICLDGTYKTAQEWALEYAEPGIHPHQRRQIIERRIATGWDFEEAVVAAPTEEELADCTPVCGQLLEDGRILVDGETFTVEEWSDQYNIPVAIIKQRIAAGLDPEFAVTSPPTVAELGVLESVPND